VSTGETTRRSPLPRLLGSIPAPIAGCPTSRSFFARCGIPRAFPSSLLRSPQLRTGAPCSHQRCPDFLLRSTSHHRVCGFLSKKAAWSCSTPPRSTGNPGYVGRKRWAKPTKAFRTELYASFLSAGTKRNGGFSSPGTHTPSLAPACPARSRNFFRALLSSRGADWWNSLPRRHWQTRI
jgi:hypothetical protein